MTVVIWITPTTWPAVTDAARAFARDEADLRIIHVTEEEPLVAAHGAFAGLLGRGRPSRDPGARLEAAARERAQALLDEAQRRLGRPSRTASLTGRTEHVVVRAAEGAELLVCGRDGDLERLGPHSLTPTARFVVDHAPCPVLLVWPGAAPGIGSIPPPPPPHQGRVAP